MGSISPEVTLRGGALGHFPNSGNCASVVSLPVLNVVPVRCFPRDRVMSAILKVIQCNFLSKR